MRIEQVGNLRDGRDSPQGRMSGKIMSQIDKPRQGLLANTWTHFEMGGSLLATTFGVNFIDWLDLFVEILHRHSAN